MKKWIALLLAMIMALSLGLEAAGAEIEGTVIDSEADRGIVPKGADENGLYPVNPVIPGENPVSGLPWEGKYYPIMVMIDNVYGAIPQYGITEADIIYEMPIDIRMTRLVALFSTQYSDWAGPVRSTRVMHVELRQEWGATLVHAGGQGAKGTSYTDRFKDFGLAVDDMHRINIISMAPHSSDYGKNNNQKKSPHNHGVRLAKLYDDLCASDIPEAAPRPFLFADELPGEGDDAGYLYMEFGSAFDTDYRYNSERNAYERYIYKGASPYVEMYDEDKTTLAYNNVIIQWTDLSYYNYKTNRPVLVEVGEGNADIFMGGKHISGYWVRTGYDDRTIFFDNEGNEIRLQRGNTWITVASPHFCKVTYRDQY